MLIAEALRAALSLGVARLDSQLLLGHVLQRPREWLLAHDDERLDAAATSTWLLLLQRRAAGEPLAYLLGEKEFCGLMLQVGPAVLVPRPETELLVEWALQCLPEAPTPCVIDLGTGSGAVALAIKHASPASQLTATDASAQALAVAGSNARRHRLMLDFAAGDWWHAVPGRRFGLAVSNPPYVASSDPHLAALQHEPLSALTPGGDGLGALRQLIDAAPPHLEAGAWLLLEHGHDQAAAVHRLLAARGFSQIQTRADLAGLPRCTGGKWQPAVD